MEWRIDGLIELGISHGITREFLVCTDKVIWFF